MSANPLLDAFRSAVASLPPDQLVERREQLIRRYSFAVPTPEAIDLVAQVADNGVIEIGAGTGYWARALSDEGIDVIAYDIHPPPSSENAWFGGCHPWFAVRRGDEREVASSPDRALLLVWPTRADTWVADAVRLYHAAGGHCVVYVGEPPGGRTGDDALQKLLGNLSTCAACAYGAVSAMCLCSTPTLFEPNRQVPLPNWPDSHDRLSVHHRLSSEGAPRNARSGAALRALLGRIGGPNRRTRADRPE